jgi:hypothetical protein
MPENQLKELENLVAETKMYNNALRDHFESGKRRRRRSTKNAVDIYDELHRVLAERGTPSADSFLMKKDGITVLKCESPRFLTPDPEDVHPQQMSPGMPSSVISFKEVHRITGRNASRTKRYISRQTERLLATF